MIKRAASAGNPIRSATTTPQPPGSPGAVTQARPPFRDSVCAPCTLNATRQSRVTLLLQQEHFSFLKRAVRGPCQEKRSLTLAPKTASTRILGRRTAPFSPFLITHRVPRGLTQDPSTNYFSLSQRWCFRPGRKRLSKASRGIARPAYRHWCWVRLGRTSTTHRTR